MTSTTGFEDENYHSASDEDFDPANAENTAAAEDNEASSSDDDNERDHNASVAHATKRKSSEEAKGLDLDFENSGDEGVIRKGRKKAKRKGDAYDEDEGGEGGLIKTRAQRRTEQIERSRPVTNLAAATVDVDALWASMTSQPIGRPQTPPTLPHEATASHVNAALSQANQNDAASGGKEGSILQTTAKSGPQVAVEEEMITITRSYEFAGDTVSETKRIPRGSAEALLWLSQQDEATRKAVLSTAGKTEEVGTVPEVGKQNGELRRPLKRRSIFDEEAPTSTTTANGVGRAGTVGSSASRRADQKAKAGKLTTVEKSRVDWAGYVDKEGISEELGKAQKGKSGYMNRMDFLGRVEGRQEADRMATKGKS